MQCHIYHIWCFKKVRSILEADITASFVSAFVLSRLDYCNMVLANLTTSITAPLQQAQNVTARLIKGLGPRDHVTSAIWDLYWLHIQHEITYNLCVLMHPVHRRQSVISIKSRYCHCEHSIPGLDLLALIAINLIRPSLRTANVVFYTVHSDASWIHFCLNVHLLHRDNILPLV